MSDISQIAPEVMNVATNLADLSQGQIDKQKVEGF